MLNEFLDMLFSRMGKALESHILWTSSTLMWLGGVSTMGVLFRECGRKLHLFPSISKFPFMDKKILFLYFVLGDGRKLYYCVLLQLYLGFQRERVFLLHFLAHSSKTYPIYLESASCVLFLSIVYKDSSVLTLPSTLFFSLHLRSSLISLYPSIFLYPYLLDLVTHTFEQHFTCLIFCLYLTVPSNMLIFSSVGVILTLQISSYVLITISLTTVYFLDKHCKYHTSRCMYKLILDIGFDDDGGDDQDEVNYII